MDIILRDLEKELCYYPHSKGRLNSYFTASQRAGRTQFAGNNELLLEQYSALENLAKQCSKTVQGFSRNISVEYGAITKISINNSQFIDGELDIPAELIWLKKITCVGANLTKINLPKTLTELQYINCNSNELYELVIPETFSKLKILYCSNNQLQSLILPHTLASLKEVQCFINNLSELVIPPTLTNLQEIYCGGNQLQSLCLPDTLKNLRRVSCSQNNLSDLTRSERLRKKVIIIK